MNNKVSVVIPVYNEENNIKIFSDRLISTLEKIGTDYEIIFVLDPSTDKTEKIILELIKVNKKIKLITLSGKIWSTRKPQWQGIQNISGDICVIIDCDLQDPPELIYDMYQKMNEGFDAVREIEEEQGRRNSNKKNNYKVWLFSIEKILILKFKKYW